MASCRDDACGQCPSLTPYRPVKPCWRTFSSSSLLDDPTAEPTAFPIGTASFSALLCVISLCRQSPRARSAAAPTCTPRSTILITESSEGSVRGAASARTPGQRNDRLSESKGQPNMSLTKLSG